MQTFAKTILEQSALTVMLKDNSPSATPSTSSYATKNEPPGASALSVASTMPVYSDAPVILPVPGSPPTDEIAPGAHLPVLPSFSSLPSLPSLPSFSSLPITAPKTVDRVLESRILDQAKKAIGYQITEKDLMNAVVQTLNSCQKFRIIKGYNGNYMSYFSPRLALAPEKTKNFSVMISADIPGRNIRITFAPVYEKAYFDEFRESCVDCGTNSIDILLAKLPSVMPADVTYPVRKEGKSETTPAKTPTKKATKTSSSMTTATSPATTSTTTPAKPPTKTGTSSSTTTATSPATTSTTTPAKPPTKTGTSGSTTTATSPTTTSTAIPAKPPTGTGTSSSVTTTTSSASTSTTTS